jgi:beta-glucosidase
VFAVACERPEIIQQNDSGGTGSDVKEEESELDKQVKLVLSNLSLADKVDQMAGPVGGDIFSTPDNKKANIRGFKFRDGPRGVRLMVDGTTTCFPVGVARAATWDYDLEKRVGAAIGLETKGLGHNVILAPTINTLRHPGNGRAQESYGEDPWLLGNMGSAFVEGAQQHVAACVKHLAGNNIEDTRMTNNAVMDEQTLRENYTRQFRMVVQDADVACVMSAYNKVNGSYCSENKHLLRDILKGEWQFEGFVLSDWFAAKSTAESANAGLDVEMPWRVYYGQLELAVNGGVVSEDVIDEAVSRILRTKLKYGFAYLDDTQTFDSSVVESDEHIALAREAAEKSIVLLKNAESALPLTQDDTLTIAVVGPFADKARLGDNGSSKVIPSYAVTPFQGIQNAAGVAATVVTSKDASAAIGADVAIVVGALTPMDEGEAITQGGDRDELGLSKEDEALILEVSALVSKTIVVLEAGGPITMEVWKDEVDAVVMAWYPGMEGGNALGDLLFGKLNFSGRLVQTWPHKLEDEPVFGNHQAETEFIYYHGYRHFDENEIEPLFPFGFGLSYTTFEVSNLVVPTGELSADDTLTVTVDVKNTGAMQGAEVVQLYVGYPHSLARRPAKELKGYVRIELEPGEKKTATITLPVSELAYYDMDQKAWVVEPVVHEILVGYNARDLPLKGEISVVVGQ